MKLSISFLFLLILPFMSTAQSASYLKQKAEKLAQKSPFEKIVDRELPATIEYEDEFIIAFIPLCKKLGTRIAVF